MPSEEKFALTESDYRKDLEKQLRALANAAERFDAGDMESTDELVMRIWKLIGDRFNDAGNLIKKNPSLLTLLQAKPTEIVDISFDYDFGQTRNLRGPFAALCILPAGEHDHIALLDGFEDYPNFYQNCTTEFLTWWNAPILCDGHRQIFSRRSIIETMRDKEAMHTDTGLPMSYGRLVYQNTINIKSARLHVEPTSRNIVNAVVRQVAHELLRTLVPDYPLKFSIKSGKTANPIVLVEHYYINAAGNSVRIYDYNAYKYLTVWADSIETADTFMNKSSTDQFLTSTYIEFLGERVPSHFLPSSLRLVFCNYYPMESTVARSNVGHIDRETIAIVAVVTERQ